MARKLKSQAAAAAPGAKEAADNPANDVAVIAPDVELELDGRKLTVREPRFLQGLRIRAKAHALTRDLTASIQGGEGLTDDVLDVLAKHDKVVKELMLDLTEGADADWIEGLSDIDGERLLLTWWGVCGPFFVRQIARRLADSIRAQALMDQASAGPTSSPPSPTPATGQPASSASATPSVN